MSPQISPRSRFANLSENLARKSKDSTLLAAYSRRTGCALVAVSLIGMRVSLATAQTITWVPTNGTGYWNVAANWSGNALPTSANDVQNLNTGSTINHNTGDDTINSFYNLAAFILSGGSLTVLHDFTGSGNVTLNSLLQGGGAANSTYNVTGTTSLQGGTISGFSIVNADMLKFDGQNNRLNNVVLDKVLDLSPDSSHVHLQGTTNLISGTYNLGYNTALQFDGDRTLTNVAVNFSSANYYGFVGNNGAGTMTIDSGSSFTGRYGYIDYALYDGSGTRNLVNDGLISQNVASGGFYVGQSVNGTFTNNGTLRADGTSTRLTIYGTNFVNSNSGIVEAKNGGNVTFYPTNYTSTGSVSALSGSVISLNPTNVYSLDGTYLADGTNSVIYLSNSLTRGTGTLTTSNGGFVVLNGSLDNTGKTFDVQTDIAGTHNFQMQNGLITGGNVNNANLLRFDSNNNRLNNVVLDQPLDLTPDNSRVHLQGTTNLISGTYNLGYNTALQFDGDRTLTNVAVNFSSANYYGFVGNNGAGTMTIDATSSFTGRLGYIDYALYDGSGTRNLVNNGLISQNVASGQFIVGQSVNGTFTNNGTLRADGSGTRETIYGTNFVNSNSGIVEAKNGGNITFNPTSYASTGSVSALSGSYIGITPANVYSLDGTYLADGTNSVIYLSNSLTRGTGTLTTSNGGFVVLNGSLDNTGKTFDVTTDVAGTHNFQMQNGIITGGNVNDANLLKFDAQNNRLNNVVLDNPLDLSPDNSHVHLQGTTNLPSGTYNLGYNTGLQFDGDRTLTNVAVNFVSSGYYGFVGNNGAGTLTIDATSSLTGRLGYIGYALYDGSGTRNLVNNGLISQNVASGQFVVGQSVNGTFTNNGTLRADGTSTRLTVNPTNFVNSGTGIVEAKNGGNITFNPTSYASTGSVSALSGSYIGIAPTNVYSLDGTYLADGTNSVIYLDNSLTRGTGTLTTSNGGFVALRGSLDNTGKTFDVLTDVAGTHNFQMQNGIITGGNINDADLLRFDGNNNRLNNVVLDQPLDLTPDSSRIHLQGTTNLPSGTYNLGYNTGLQFDGDRTLTNVAINFNGSYYGFVGNNGAGTLSIDANSSFTGRLGYIGYALYDGGGTRNLVNNGLISQNVANGQFVVGQSVNGTFTNNGTLRADGTSTNITVNPTNFVNSNSGVVEAKNGGRITFNPTSYASTGLVSALSGSIVNLAPTNVYSLDGTYLADGTNSVISLSNSLTRGTGTLTTSNGGFVALNGSLDNTGKTFDVLTDVSGTHNFQMQNGIITGGNVNNANLLRFDSNNNRLNNVVLDQPLDLSPDNSRVHLQGTTNLPTGTYNLGYNTALQFDGDRTLTNVSVNFSSPSYYGFVGNNGAGTLTIDSGSSFTGKYGYVAYGIYDGTGTRNLVNNGLISQNVANGNIIVGQSVNGTFTNNGTLRADGANTNLSVPSVTVNLSSTSSVEAKNGGTISLAPTNAITNTGTLLADTNSTISTNQDMTQTAGLIVVNGNLNLGGNGSKTLNLQGGKLQGTGTVSGSVNNTGGTVAPGNSIGTLSITGNYTQTSSGFLALEFGGVPGTANSNDLLNVTGSATLDGTLSVSLLNGYIPSFGDTFTILNYGSLTTSNTNVFSNIDFTNSNFSVNVFKSGTSLKLRFAQVPSPESVAVMAGGLLGMVGLLRRRRRN